MEHLLPFASSSGRRSRRTHVALLTGLLLGLGAPGAAAGPGPAVVRTLVNDSTLWSTAARLAQASRWFLPGRATIDERSNQDGTTTETAITARLENTGSPEPRLTIDTVRIDGEDRTKSAAPEMAAGLGELVEALRTPDHPLSRYTAQQIRPAGEKRIDGALCRGFTTRAVVAELNLESTTWIDVERGYARRIDYRALNLPRRKDGATLRSLHGSSEYALDSAGRWVLVCHREHSDLKAASFLGGIELRSDKTIRCADHWEYRGPRRGKLAPPVTERR